MWYQLASHLGLPVQRVKAETTNSEFLAWQEYLRQEKNIPSKEDYYLMQIAAEVRRAGMNTKNPNLVKMDDFRLKFEAKGPDKPPTKEELERRIATSKAAWFGLAFGQNAPKDR